MHHLYKKNKQVLKYSLITASTYLLALQQLMTQFKTN